VKTLASADTADGTWRLRVADASWPEIGYLDSWKLTF
jgi:subtilisin-like proprotein convertase family protein